MILVAIIGLAVFAGFTLGWRRAHNALDDEWIAIADAWSELVGVLEGDRP